MSDPCIITVAITGSVPRKSHNPAVPISVEEQIESTHAAFEAGATIAHVHVRNAELVARVATLCGDYGRHPASVAEARRLLSLPLPEAVG